MRPRWLVAVLLFTCFVAVGCQTWTSGLSLPSGKYLEHPPQYGAPSPAFPLAKEPLPAPVAGGAIGAGIGALTGRSPGPALVTGTMPNPTGKNPVQIERGQLDEFTLKADGLALNNFCLSDCLGDSEGMRILRLVASCRNRTSEIRTFCLMVAGLNESRELLWACNVEGRVYPDTVALLKETTIPVPAGTLKQTAFVSLRLNANKPATAVSSRTIPTVVVPALGGPVQQVTGPSSEPAEFPAPPLTPMPGQAKPPAGKPTGATSPEKPTQIVMLWQPDILEAPYPTRRGITTPGLGGRMLLTGAEGLPGYFDGTLTIVAHDISACGPNSDASPVSLYRWTFPGDVLRQLTKEDSLGKGYTLYCPFPPGVLKPAITRVQLQAAFESPGATLPLYSDPYKMSLGRPASKIRPQPTAEEKPAPVVASVGGYPFSTGPRIGANPTPEQPFRNQPPPALCVAMGDLFLREALDPECPADHRIADLDKARVNYQQALRNDPEYAPAQKGLACCQALLAVLKEGKPLPDNLTPPAP